MQQSAPIRQPDYPIEPMFYSRWSPRAFSDEVLDETELLTMLEAARWAPSAFNLQPWRFAYAMKDSDWWQPYLGTLLPFNQDWAQRAQAIVYVLSQAPQAGEDSTASLDAGAAWAHVALQAYAMGLTCRGIAGFDPQLARKTLNIPASFNVEMAIAVGRKGQLEDLPEKLRSKETPTPRRPLRESAFAGGFPNEKDQ